MRNPLSCRYLCKYEEYKYYNWLCLFLCIWLSLAITSKSETFTGVKTVVSVILLSEFVSFTRNRALDPTKVLVLFWLSCLYARKLYEIAVLRDLFPTTIEGSLSCDKLVSEYTELDSCFEPCNKLAPFLNQVTIIENNVNVGNIPAYLTNNIKYAVFGNKFHLDVLEKHSCDAVITYVGEYKQGAMFYLLRYIIWGLFFEHVIKGISYITRGIAAFFIHAIRFLPTATHH